MKRDSKEPTVIQLANRQYALSIKQPWCSLILHGLKSIEIRRWPTRIRQTIYLHAARIPDERPTGWELLDAASRATSELLGGVIGEVDLIDCKFYRTLKAFEQDQLFHRNLPKWFERQGMYGFVLANPRPVKFYPFKGNAQFFTVPIEASRST